MTNTTPRAIERLNDVRDINVHYVLGWLASAIDNQGAATREDLEAAIRACQGDTVAVHNARGEEVPA